MDRVFHYRWVGRGAILAVKNMNVPSAYDSRASKRAMSSSCDSYLRLTGRVVPFSRPYGRIRSDGRLIRFGWKGSL